MSRILVVDDEPTICWALQQALSEDGHTVTVSSTAEEALQNLEQLSPDLVMLDVRLPGMDGLAALNHIRERAATTPVIVMTAFGDLETAVQAIHRGAFEYLLKPFDLDQVTHAVNRALTHSSSETPSTETAGNVAETGQLLGSSPAMQAIYRHIALVADQDVPVLITGESGTGKELVAAAVHRYSKRAKQPFIPVCIPAFNESVVESELFGHARGAFTGAVDHRIGLLEAADRGTAFFDEIGDISPSLQVKLLRVLESKVITPVGSNEPRQTDFRLIAATNRNLEAMVADQSFREDLYYRLNVYQIQIPPLRERTEDIPILANKFMRAVDPQGRVTLSDSAVEELTKRPWHGNVRELRNVIEQAVLATRSGQLTADCIPVVSSSIKQPREAQPLDNLEQTVRDWVRHCADSQSDGELDSGLYDAFLETTEPLLFEEVLQLSKGNRQEAAKILGIHRQTLRDKMKKHQMD
ncbi:Nitrogen regulation protein NR(I) [Thalassoglobus neptunius]|uniref:DNA-binding transcriptional regulator NtrC n=1 Tax=Thalassoglobus neptunius TaxID=1938619 RepID=A0A5C5W6N7_9PLAN|nr:sigma-54 dependent transcriptional regulator [Thalassoglobus neptunius]TWT46350.1 Nitrogen regulation protein NR(I) [Thalassoglobus neptunius]